MPAELILLEDVEGLGSLGDHVRVATGYARNYLLPRKLAAPVSAANLRRLEAKKLRMQQDHAERLGVAEALAEKVAKTSVTIPVQAAENDKLYGSIMPAHISEALETEGITIDRQDIQMDEPIRDLGVYNVDIQLHAEVTAALKVWVVRA